MLTSPRLAHTIFVADVQYTIHFTHHASLSVGMMKLPFPSAPSVWEAKSPSEWETQMRLAKQSTRAKFYSLNSSIVALMSIKDADHRHEFTSRFDSSNPFALHILIHGIASAIGDDKYRTVTSSSSFATHILKISDFDEALRYWHGCFNRMPDVDKLSGVSWSALLMYHFANVLLRNNISDIQMAAGSAFSFGRMVTAQRAQDAHKRLATTLPVGHESYMHGLAIVNLCLQDATERSQEEIAPPRPPWQIYCAFLGALILWARTVSLEKLGRSRANNASHGISPYSVTDAEFSIMRHAANTAVEPVAKMVNHELNYSDLDIHDVYTTKEDLYLLIQTVRERLGGSSWYICKSKNRTVRHIQMSLFL